MHYTYLEEGAARWYKTLPQSDTNDLETVFAKMKERICPEERRRLINQELFTMIQKEGETMENFIKRFETKAQLVNLTDERLISGFIRVLRPDIQEWVMLSRPALLQAAFETARIKYTTSRAIATTPKSKEVNMVEEEPQIAAMRSPKLSEFFPNDAWRTPVDQLARKSGKKKVTFEDDSDGESVTSSTERHSKSGDQPGTASRAERKASWPYPSRTSQIGRYKCR